MAGWFGARLVHTGPNRLAVISRLRRFFSLSPADGKALLDGGAVLLVSNDTLDEAWRAAQLFREVGAEVEVFVSTPCPSNAPRPLESTNPDAGAPIG